MRVLGIETSCDETGVAVYDEKLGLMAHNLHTQTALHAPYGGVVPELASRDHLKRLAPLLFSLLEEASIDPKTISAIAYTAGPGLAGALLVGAAFAHALAYAWKIPILPIHHLEAHLLSCFLEKESPTYPFVGLLVSGGHTLLIHVQRLGCYQILGESLDDAAGEAFDKTAKLLGLAYPGGPLLATLAESGCPTRFPLPRPLLNKATLNFSFSGLKTAVMHALKKIEVPSPQDKADLASGLQEAIVDTLLSKCQKALRQTGCRALVIAGGVSANQRLRQKFSEILALSQISLYYPRQAFCTDNGAMIAYAGYEKLRQAGGMGTWWEDPRRLNIQIFPRWPLDKFGSA